MLTLLLNKAHSQLYSTYSAYSRHIHLPVPARGGTGPGLMLLAAEYSLGICLSLPQRAHSVLVVDIASSGKCSRQEDHL